MQYWETIYRTRASTFVLLLQPDHNNDAMDTAQYLVNPRGLAAAFEGALA
jgi:hypothetical protein